MLDSLPWFIVQKIFSLLSYDDLCNTRKVCRTNKTLNEYFETFNIEYQSACPICIMQRPFETIGLDKNEYIEEKLRKLNNLHDGNFFVQLKTLTTGNENWSAQKDEDGWFLSRKYKYLIKRIHINSNKCPEYCDDLIRCIDNPRCPSIKYKNITRDLAQTFHPDSIEIYKKQELKQHLLVHFKSNYSLPKIKSIEDLNILLSDEYINSSTRDIKSYPFNEYENNIRISYQPYFGSLDISEFESDFKRLVLCRYLKNQQKYLKGEYNFKIRFFKFDQVLEIHSIALKTLRDLRFSNPPNEIIYNQMKYYEILNLLLPAACHNLFS